jgi:hypothetical protein
MFLPDFNQIFIISTDFHTSPPVSNFKEIRPVRAVLIYADRRTDRRLDMTKLTGDSRDDANASKNIKVDLRGQDVW